MIPEGGALAIKIDIEGAEYGLLPHMRPLLDRAAAVLLSFHPRLLLASVDGDRREALRLTRAALLPLRDLSARQITSYGPGRPSLAPTMLRWGLRSTLPGDDWLFTRQSPTRSR